MILRTVVPNVIELVVIPWFVARYLPASTPVIDITLVVSRGCEVSGIGVLRYSLYERRP